MLRLLALLGIIEIVILLDKDGQEFWTYKRKRAIGGYQAFVYPFTRVGHVILNDDGTCSGRSCYIKSWIPYD